MDNCNRHNYETVSHVHLNLGTSVEHPRGITRHDSKVKFKRSRNVFS